mmetsp:Transcript_2455/g.1521  ORF Transcript_2455/g.1521 Transcript_2455/m.1521 type:complete len:216 (+) Transcript_2455:429-1076(+)
MATFAQSSSERSSAAGSNCLAQTSIVTPDSRSSFFSPMANITFNPASRATLSFFAQSSSSSPAIPNPSRRSECPMITHSTPASTSCDAQISPVYAPIFSLRPEFWAPIAISARRVDSTTPRWMYGAQIATSTLAGIGPASLKVLTSSATDAMVPLHFQFPPMRYVRSPSAAGSPTDNPFGLPLCTIFSILASTLSLTFLASSPIFLTNCIVEDSY